jgi:hypothetical protein
VNEHFNRTFRNAVFTHSRFGFQILAEKPITSFQKLTSTSRRAFSGTRVHNDTDRNKGQMDGIGDVHGFVFQMIGRRNAVLWISDSFLVELRALPKCVDE